MNDSSNFDKLDQYDREILPTANALREACEKAGISYLLVVHVQRGDEGDTLLVSSMQGEFPVPAALGVCQRLIDTPSEVGAIARAMALHDVIFGEPTLEGAPEGEPLN